MGESILKKYYLTVSKEGTAEIIEKKSRFIANVKNVSLEEEAIEYLEEVRKKYWDATHNVYAYCIGGPPIVQKFSDDGEPPGTAGKPILEIIQKEGLEDVIVVVTRYFGGTLLGTGGLVRAYSRSAKEGIKAAGIVKRVLSAKFNLKIDYGLIGKLNNLLTENGYKTLEVDYADVVSINIAVPVDNTNKFKNQIYELGSGNILLNKIDEGYYITTSS